MRICLISDGNGWIIDRIAGDFKKYSKHQIVDIRDNPNILWSVNLFSFPKIRQHIPSSCSSFVSIHHIDETKLKEYAFADYNCASGCIVPNKITFQTTSKYLSIPIYQLPYWLSSSFLKKIDSEKVNDLRKKINPEGCTLIGSFVKDGEGRRGDNPKLSKGPDVLVEVLKKMKSCGNIKVILAGYGRNYVISNLKKLNVPYAYLENYEDINSLYDCLDWYISTSRTEGGPQSVLEASYRKIKILSSACGMASEVLHPDCICFGVDEFVDKFKGGVDQTEYNYNIVSKGYLPQTIIKRYDEFFEGK